MDETTATTGRVLTSVMTGFSTTVTAARLSREDDRIKALLDAAGESREARRSLMISLREEGWTLQQIGDVLGLSPQSVRQMIHHKPRNKKEATR